MSLSEAFSKAVTSEMRDIESGIGSFFSGEHARNHCVHEHGHGWSETERGGMEGGSASGQVISDEIQINGERHYEVAFNTDNGQTHTAVVPAGDMYPRRGDEVQIDWDSNGKYTLNEPARDYER
jgi:hypothetical protein